MNLIRTVSSARFICCCWRNPWCDCHVTHTPKCGESAKILGNYELWLRNTHYLCFPCAANELRHSLDMALLTKCRYYCKTHLANLIRQPNELKQEIEKKMGEPKGGQAKIWGGHDPPRPPLESLLVAFKDPLILDIGYLSSLGSSFVTEIQAHARRLGLELIC